VDDSWAYAGMQNADIDLGLVNCPVCPVTDDTNGTEPEMWSDPSRISGISGRVSVSLGRSVPGFTPDEP